MQYETVLEVTHYTDRLFKFKTTRDKSFKFKNGEFAMIGLETETKPLLRAYSITSTCYEDHLEFLSIKVPDGPLTSRLQNILEGDTILIKPKTTGSLVIDYLKPKKNLVLLATGTGIAPFISIVNDYETYERFENVLLFHTVRDKNELAYLKELTELSQNMNLKYIESVTNGNYVREGRFWDWIEESLPNNFSMERDSIMVCGSPELNKECRTMFSELGWQEGNTGEMGDFMLERAFAG